MPEFIEGDVFKTIIPLHRIRFSANASLTTWPEIKMRLGDKLGDKLGDRLGKTEWKILEILWQNPTSSISELAEKIEISKTAIENNISKLKKKQFLERIGSAKRGHWKIMWE
jgi:ATP-dependent DNA helicase RecG